MKIIDITKGLSGITLIQLSSFIPPVDNLTEILKLGTQVIIAIATIISLFKKKKKKIIKNFSDRKDYP